VRAGKGPIPGFLSGMILGRQVSRQAWVKIASTMEKSLYSVPVWPGMANLEDFKMLIYGGQFESKNMD